MKKYFLAIDEGTTGTRAIVYDKAFEIKGYAYCEINKESARSGCVEEDYTEIYEKTVAMCSDAMTNAKISPDEIISIGITHQRNTQCVWDRKTGKPLIKAIVWQDTRTGKLLEEERKKSYIKDNEVARCGREFSESSAPVLLKWIMQNHPDIAKKAQEGEVAYGCVGTWLVWCFTEGRTHAMAYSSASSLQIYDFLEDEMCWRVIDGAGIPRSIFPELREEASDYGFTTVFGPAIPITAVIGDQQASMFGQGCRKPGSAKCTNGTGTFMDVNIGDKYFEPHTGMLTMVAWSINGKKTYVFEGQIKVCGSVFQWFRDELELVDDMGEIQKIAESVEDTDGVIFVTTMAGTCSPVYDPFARGTLFGLHLGTKKAHIVRAALEGIALGLADIMDIIATQTGMRIRKLKIDGGTSRNDILAQSLADFNQCRVERTTAGSAATGAGAAMMAAVGAGVYTVEELPDIADKYDLFEPKLTKEEAFEKTSKYRDAVKRAAQWAK